MIDVKANQEKFHKLLQKHSFHPICEDIYDFLKETDFFTSPASTKYHGSYEGGLCEHSLNVYEQAMYLYKVQCKIKKDISTSFNEHDLAIAALLHDVCKTNTYKKTKKWRKDSNDKWEQYDAWEKDDSYPFGHGEKSVELLLENHISLSDNQKLAIRWHMGAFDLSDYQKSTFNEASKNPMVTILMCADYLAAKITELE